MKTRPVFFKHLSLVVGVILMGTVAQAQAQSDPVLVDEGFRLWTQETWNGNGRTCSTCHIPAESYNIFPATLKKLSNKEKDLVFAINAPGIENKALIKAHALFNISGSTPCAGNDPACWENHEHPGPVFRSSMGIFGLALTTTNNRAGFPGTPLLPAGCSVGVKNQLAQLGWAGDGSPGTGPTNFVDLNGDGENDCQVHHGFLDPAADGSIRAFCNGAIAQHHTKSLNRIPGVDFRLPTSAELDALEEFQLWLGRRALTAEENARQGTAGATEFTVTLLDFKDARVALGRNHFVGPAEFALGGGGPNPDAGAGCNGCHVNGGAMSRIGAGGSPANINIGTEVELGSDDIGLAVVGAALPHDEGASDVFGPLGPPTFEDAFNIQSIIEAAPKKAWFHNHRVVGDFEEAIAFYISDDFFSGGPPFTSEQVMRNGNTNGSISFPNGDGIEHLGAFLRALNVFYNLRDCERLLDEAIERIDLGISAENPIRHCRFNLSHAQSALRGSKLPQLYPEVLKKLPNLEAGIDNKKKNDLQSAIAKLRALRDSIATQLEVP